MAERPNPSNRQNRSNRSDQAPLSNLVNLPKLPKPGSELPKPLAAAAGAGDLAFEKIRELSKVASDRLSSMESDPTTLADQLQERIETRAESLGTAFREASTTVRGQAQVLSDRAQAALLAAYEQAGDTYETLARRGEDAVVRLRGEDAHAEPATVESITPATPTEPAESATPPASKSTASKATTSTASTASKDSKDSKPAKSTASKSTASKSTASKSTAKKSGTTGTAKKSTGTAKTSGTRAAPKQNG